LGFFKKFEAEIFVKVGEWNVCGSNVDPLSLSARARCITNVNDEVKAVGGLVNYNCLKALRALCVARDREFYLGYYDN